MNSSQLELELEDVRVRVPWDGRSPRALTRCAMRPIFKARAAKKHERICLDPFQLEFALTGEKAPWVYQGAPLLKE